MKLKKSLISALLLNSSLLIADIKLSHFFNNNMVIQRDTQAPIWGRADVGEKISIKASWGAEAQVQTDNKGKWMVKIQTPEAGGPHTLTFQANNKIELKNVLSGDVWICSGQSNMAWAVGQLKGAWDDIHTAKFPDIRFYKMGNVQSTIVLKDNQARWEVCSPGVARAFSATGFYFGREIYKNQKNPIGLISTNWNGTKIEPWILAQGYRMIPELKELTELVNTIDPMTSVGKEAYKKYFLEIKKWLNASELDLNQSKPLSPQPQAPTLGASHQSPTYLYNGMVHPIVPAAIKGVIWYQGESNDQEGLSYYYKMQALIKGWREVFNQGDFPFYFVQLANYKVSDPDNAEGGDGWAKLRQAQLDSLQIKNSGMAVTIDIGDAKDIHPKNKQDVGKRLALWALAKDYNNNDIVYSGPLFKSKITKLLFLLTMHLVA